MGNLQEELTNKSLENQLFESESGGELQEPGCYLYSECTLKVDIGPYKMRTEVYTIVVNYNESTLSIYENPQDCCPSHVANLQISIVQ